MAEPAEGEAEDHLGLQNPVPRRHVSSGRQKDSLRRHGSNCSIGFEGAYRFCKFFSHLTIGGIHK